MDPALAAMLRGALGLLLLAAAWHKLRDLSAFGTALAGYRLLPAWATGIVAPAFAATEVGAGAALLAPVNATPGALLGAALLLIYTTAILVNLVRGRRDIDCGCGGPALKQPLGPALVARNVVLLGASLVCLLPAGTRPLFWLDALTVLAGVATLAALYTALQHLLAIAPGLARLREEAA
jgi:hypothetical protein